MGVRRGALETRDALDCGTPPDPREAVLSLASLVEADGKIFIAAFSDHRPILGGSKVYDFALARYDADGSLDLDLWLDQPASISALLLTTEALVSEIKEDQKAPAMPPGGGMGDMGGMY